MEFRLYCGYKPQLQLLQAVMLRWRLCLSSPSISRELPAARHPPPAPSHPLSSPLPSPPTPPHTADSGGKSPIRRRKMAGIGASDRLGPPRNRLGASRASGQPLQADGRCYCRMFLLFLLRPMRKVVGRGTRGHGSVVFLTTVGARRRADRRGGGVEGRGRDSRLTIPV